MTRELTLYALLIAVGFLPNEVWRWLGVVVARGIDEKSELITWVRAVATAILAGVVPPAASTVSASCMAACQFGMVPRGPNTSMWASTDSMRSVTSFWKPFITDSTTIRAATPSAMPAMDNPEINEIKRLSWPI